MFKILLNTINELVQFFISKAGGYLNNADKKELFVEYQNGQNKSTNNFLIFKFYPKFKSSAKIIV